MIRHIPFNAVQTALYKLLSQGQDIPVVSGVTLNTTNFPYIYMGEFSGTPINENKTEAQHSISQTLHIWSENKGKKEVNSIMDDVCYLATKYQLPIEGYRQLGDVNVEHYQVIGERYEDSPPAYHGILILNYFIEQE
jgi:hypothetical protein